MNDAFGHDADDLLLCHYADILKSEINVDQIMARVGSDEFVVVGRIAQDDGWLIDLAHDLIRHNAGPVLINDNLGHSGISA